VETSHTSCQVTSKAYITHPYQNRIILTQNPKESHFTLEHNYLSFKKTYLPVPIGLISPGGALPAVGLLTIIGLTACMGLIGSR
jgi:hypothetical protein